MNRYQLVALTLTVLAAASASGQDTRGPVGYWPFEEPDGLVVLDASGSARAGAILSEGRGVKRVPGRLGGGLEFVGGDPGARGQAGCVALSGLDGVGWSKGLTVELWVCFTGIDRPQTYELVSNTRDDRGPGFRFMLSWLSLQLRSGEGGAGTTWGAGTNPALVQFRPGEWYHLAGTYDGSVYRVYVDGALCATSTPGLTLPPGDPTVYLGAYHAGYAYGLNAVVDDLRLYDYARTPAQVILDARLSD